MNSAEPEAPHIPRASSVPFGEAARVWARIGLLSFGGPAGQIALMHRELVEKRRWLSETRFMHALNYCMLLPGPEAQQLAVYIGWLLHRTAGGLVAGTLFILPGFVTILGLSALYAGFREVPLVAALFFGLKAAVLAVVVEAVLRIGKRALRSPVMVTLAALSFAALFLFGVPFPIVVGAAALLGFAGSHFTPRLFPTRTPDAPHARGEPLIDAMLARGELTHTRPSARRALRVLLVGLLIWFAPLLLLLALAGASNVFVQEGLFFSQAAVVTFGGAYAVLSYVAQRAVETYGWLHPGEMLDGLGLAETTPGPLILVVQFVGFMGAFRHAEGLPPMLAGVLGSVLTVWVTFVPCFIWIFVGAPYIEALRAHRALHAALSAITAAVVGVIANLSVWFAAHTLFAKVDTAHFGPVRVLAPQWETLNVPALVLAAVAMLLMFGLRLGLAKTLAASALLGLLWHAVA